MDEWCADLVALLDREGVKRAIVGGHCLGANVALHFAARHSNRTAGLLLIEPMPHDALIGEMRTFHRLRYLFRALALLARSWNALGLKRKRVEPMDLEQWDKAAASGEKALSSFAAPLGDLRSTPTAAYLQSLCGVFEPLPPAAAIRCPALALISGRSTMTDPALTRAAMQALSAEVVDLDAEHWIPTERPQEMRAAIEGWLARFDRK